MINKKRLIRLILEVLFYGFIIGIGVNYPYYQRAIVALMVVISVKNEIKKFFRVF